MENLVPYLLSLVLAFLVESLVEYLFGTPVDQLPALKPYHWLLMYVSAVAGVALSFYYSTDLVAFITKTDITPVGIGLTGLIIGRGANYLHQFVSTYFPKGEKKSAYKYTTTAGTSISVPSNWIIPGSEITGDKGETRTLTGDEIK